MNLIYQYLALVLGFQLLNCLSINDLKIDQFLNPESPIKLPGRDFLDIDVTSDVLPTISEVKDSTADEITSSSDIFTFKDKTHSPYKCWIESELDERRHSSGLNYDMAKQVLFNRRKSCYYFKGKSWVYEYCHLKSTRQVSRTKINDNHEEFYLGRFYPPRHGLNFNRELNYFDTEFYDGSYCDLTNSPRTSHIRFICANEKQSMYITNVMETSACSYEFLIHVPELCSYLPRHAKDTKQFSKIKCVGYKSKKPIKVEKIDSPTIKTDKRLDDLDQILDLIETSYKDSNILTQYKSLLLKATEKLKSQQLSKDLSRSENDASLIEMLTKMSKHESEATADQDENDDSEIKK